MRKFTLILSLLVAFVTTAMAQVEDLKGKKIAAIGDPATSVTVGQWYILNNVGRNNIVSEETTAMKMRATSSVAANDLAENKAGYLFKITLAEDGEHYNIMSGNGIYFALSSNASSISETPVRYVIGNQDEEIPSVFYLYDDDNKYCADGQETDNNFVGWSSNYSTSTTGNDAYRLLPITLESASIAEVTYQFQYNGVTKYTQTTSVEVGAEYPDFNIEFPYGVSAVKPEGTISADDVTDGVLTKVIELTIDLPFQLSNINGTFDENVKWYNLKMRSKDVTYDPTTGYALAQDVEEKGVYNLFAFAGNPFDGYSIYNYVAGANKIFWREDATNGGRVSFTNIEETNNNTWILSANGTSGYVFRLNGYDTGYMNDHQPQIAIWNSSWGATDAGSTFTFTLVDDPDLTILHDVTYNYYYEEKLVSTKTVTVENGANYPAHSYKTPYGVSIVEEVPTETVSATVTKDFTLIIVDKVPFNAAEDGTPTTWYYTRMHGNMSVQSYIEDNGDGKVEWSDKSVTEENIESHLWGFVGNIFDGFKVVNKGTGKAIASIGSGNASMAEVANATAFIAMPSQNTTEGAFCLKYPSNGQYLNAQGSAVAHWGSNDNGSSFFLDEYNETEISVSDLGWATMYLNIPVYIPEGVNAYIITGVANGYVTKTQLEGTIPANTGILLENAGTFTFKRSAASGTDVATTTDNLMNGSVENSYIEGKAYVLANGIDGIGFYIAKLNKDGNGNDGTTHFLNNAGKAYLVLPVEQASATYYGFDWEGTTGVENVTIENGVETIFDLTGRKIESVTAPGIYIINGKKVLVK